ncbi:MAG: DIP1984 family protein [Lachnospiraceae bacterium]|nr:DIP1984 family protein [Lachnospiraceae bacterium]
MKLAEALHLRADLQKRIAQTRERLKLNSKVQEGDTPSEDPEVLLEELNRDTERLQQLIAQINLTNSKIESEGVTLTEMIAKKDVLSLKTSILREFLQEASEKIERYSNKEIRILSTVDVQKLQKEVDQMSQELRILDVKLQSLNWSVDLIE